MKRLLLLGFLCTGVASAATVCPPVVQWQRSFGTPAYENGTAVVQRGMAAT